MGPWNLKMSNNNVRYTRKELLNKNRKKPCVCCCVLQTTCSANSLPIYCPALVWVEATLVCIGWHPAHGHTAWTPDTAHRESRTLDVATPPGDRCGAIRIHWDTPRLLGTRSTTVTPSLYTGHSVAIMSNSRTRQLWWWWQEVPDDIENKDITKEDD